MPGGSCRIPKAAALFGIVVTEPSVVLARGNAAIERLDRRLVQAQRAGDPSFFNKTYKLRRQQTQAEDRPFMPYTAARARLQRSARRRRGGR
jgi:hypothetical protein